MARTAVIAGTASATAGAVQRRGAQKAAAQQQAQAPQYEPAPPPPPAPEPAPVAAAPAEDDLIAQLQQLADLKAQGLLDDAEFASAKAKLLA
jgi:hypothetical protein